jgi:hypothetical protein
MAGCRRRKNRGKNIKYIFLICEMYLFCWGGKRRREDDEAVT